MMIVIRTFTLTIMTFCMIKTAALVVEVKAVVVVVMFPVVVVVVVVDANDG